ncbi:MAG: protein-methionine-sulfoxide reductase heme-binding subunit MsrQ [Natronospirillum sp.]
MAQVDALIRPDNWPDWLKRSLVHLACAAPMVYWGWQTLLTVQGQHTLISTDPGAVLADKTGFWAINLILTSLVLTPLQKLYKIRWVTYRRAIGLWAFAYVMLHVVVFYSLILGADLAAFWHELSQRPYIVAGALAAILLFPLAATSTQAAMRLLKKRWKTLHKLIYPIAVLAVVHQLWQVKSFEMVAVIHTLVLAALLGIRLYWWQQKRLKQAQARPTR